jgi:hypothetical protein
VIVRLIDFYQSKFPNAIEEEAFPQGLKPGDFCAFTARLKPCPFKTTLAKIKFALNGYPVDSGNPNL